MALAPNKGVKLPLRKGRGGFFSTVSGDEAVKQNIRTILATRPGERVHEPEFGSRLWELVFEPIDQVIYALARQFIFDAIEQFEPRVIPVEVIVDLDPNSNRMAFVLSYRIRNNLTEQDEVTVPAQREIGFL